MSNFESPDRPPRDGDPRLSERDAEVDDLCRRADPREPGEAHWAVCLLGVRRGLEDERRKLASDRRRWWLGSIAGFAAAVAFVLVSTQVYFLVVGSPAVVTPWPVVSASEVQILHLDSADRDSLVVGTPPVDEPLVMVAPGDVVVKEQSYELKPIDMEPTDKYTPMIVVPLAKLTNDP